jgi:5-methylthioadenosine/S-adenosylhomocysteine deaminase
MTDSVTFQISPCRYVNPKGLLREGDLTIQGGRIIAIGQSAPEGCEIIDGRGLIFFPGLIQTHVHLCQTLLRGVADDLGLETWLKSYIWPMEAAHTPESLRASAELGLAELLLGGTTTIVDMGTVRHTDVLFQTAERMGIRYFGGKTLMTDREAVPPALWDGPLAAIDESEDLAARWHGRADGRLNYAVSPRFRVSCTPETMTEAAGLALAKGLLFHTHASETRWENEYIHSLTGRTNIQELDYLGCLGPRALLAHGIWIQPDEWDILVRAGTMTTHCPSANCKLGSGILPMEEYRNRKIPFSLGADGPPCNNNLDALTEARLALHLQNARHGAGWVTAREALEWLTSIPADWLEIEAGRILPGARADLMAVREDSLLGAPQDWSNPAARLIYAETSRAVAMTIVDGRVLVRNGRLVDGDVEEIIRRATSERKAMVERL